MVNRLITGALTKDFKGMVRAGGYALLAYPFGVLQTLPCFPVGYYVSSIPWDADAFRRS